MSTTMEPSDTDYQDALSGLLPTPAETLRMRSHGSTIAAVLIPIYAVDDELIAVFTKRHSELRRHAGEISFPGGRRDTGEDPRQTALREAEEEIGLPRELVELVGALPPTSTFVTNYCVYPFVGLIDAGHEFVANPLEVEEVVEFKLSELVTGFEKKRLIRRGVPIKTDAYTIGENLNWGATARIVTVLLEKLDPLIEVPEPPPLDAVEQPAEGDHEEIAAEVETAGDESPAVEDDPDEPEAEASAG
jgi:8-oxo-dGTP pyrophosphatase MutT (NUDIX family)